MYVQKLMEDKKTNENVNTTHGIAENSYLFIKFNKQIIFNVILKASITALKIYLIKVFIKMLIIMIILR
jgi:hypothetical protein